MKTSVVPPLPAPTHEQIAARAHALWEASGCPDGRDLGFWLEAERELQTPLPPPAVPAATVPRRRPTGKTKGVDGLGEKTEEMLGHTGEPGNYSPTSLT